MGWQIVALWVAVGVAVDFAPGEVGSLALVPPESTPNVTPDQAEAFYQAVLTALQAVPSLHVQERRKLKVLLAERDLSEVLSLEARNRGYCASTGLQPGSTLLIPSICRTGDDYLLGLRTICVETGSTRAFAVAKTRLLREFGPRAKDLVGKLITEAGVSAELDHQVPPLNETFVAEIRTDCCRSGGDRLFPGLWARTETLYGQAQNRDQRQLLVSYYAWLLYLAGFADSPPEGMVYVPGGWVHAPREQERVWVEPFFVDQQEVTVRQYREFLLALEQRQGGRAVLGRYTPITFSAGPEFTSDDLPVTGVTWHAAKAYAEWRGRLLPSALQWVRAATCTEPVLVSVSGLPKDCPGINLKGNRDGFAILAPAAVPSRDNTPRGVLGLAGNVREWTSSGFSASESKGGPRNSVSPESTILKIVKGGGWRSAPEDCSPEAILPCKPGEAFDDVGFRCVMPFFAWVAQKSAGQASQRDLDQCSSVGE